MAFHGYVLVGSLLNSLFKKSLTRYIVLVIFSFNTLQSYQVIMHKDSEFLEFCSCTYVQQAISIGILTYIQAYASAGIHKHIYHVE